MHMVNFGILMQGLIAKRRFEVRLTQLIATARCAAPKLHLMLAQGLHNFVA